MTEKEIKHFREKFLECKTNFELFKFLNSMHSIMYIDYKACLIQDLKWVNNEIVFLIQGKIVILRGWDHNDFNFFSVVRWNA